MEFVSFSVGWGEIVFFPFGDDLSCKCFLDVTVVVDGCGIVYVYLVEGYDRRDDGGDSVVPSPKRIVVRKFGGGGLFVLQCTGVVRGDAVVEVMFANLAGLERRYKVMLACEHFTTKCLREAARRLYLLRNICDIHLSMPNMVEVVPDDFIWCGLGDYGFLVEGNAFDWAKALDSRAPRWKCSSCGHVKRSFYFDATSWMKIRSLGEAKCSRCSLTRPVWRYFSLAPHALVVGNVWLVCASCGERKVVDAFPLRGSEYHRSGDRVGSCLECCRNRQAVKCRLCGIVKDICLFDPRALLGLESVCRGCLRKRPLSHLLG